MLRYPFDIDLLRPFRELEEMRRRIDKIFADIMGRQPFGALTSGVFPALNMSEDGANLYIRAELPGVRPEDIEISLEGNTLTIRGERREDVAEHVSYHRQERQTGHFQKAISLPYEVDAENVTSELKNGILKITLPKAEVAKPKKIEVKSG